MKPSFQPIVFDSIRVRVGPVHYLFVFDFIGKLSCSATTSEMYHIAEISDVLHDVDVIGNNGVAQQLAARTGQSELAHILALSDLIGLIRRDAETTGRYAPFRRSTVPDKQRIGD